MTPTQPSLDPHPLNDELDSPMGFDPEDIKSAAKIYAESFAYRGMMSESAVIYGLLGYVQSLEGKSNDA